MVTQLHLLDRAEQLIRPLVEPHIPEGSDAQAVIDQWLHALATDSQFFL
jgi:DNA (cytosine-5)-methyltransferase 1